MLQAWQLASKRRTDASTYIAEWREFRGLSQEVLADRMDATGASVSRVESRQPPYSQDWLEVAAEILGCTPADLISRDARGSIDQAIELLRSKPAHRRGKRSAVPVLQKVRAIR